MKRNTLFRMLAAAIVAVAFPLTVAAYDFVEGGIYYNIVGSQAQVTYMSSGTASYFGSVVIPETVTHNGVTYAVTSIGNSAFNNCTSMTDVTIPNSIINIGDHAFRYCSGLREVEIPNSVETLGRCTFHSCGGLQKVVIGNGVKLIDEYDFQYCYYLTDVVLGSSVQHLAIKAFYDCSRLVNVTCLAPQPPTMYAYYSFYDPTYANGTLYVLGSSVQAYQGDPNWQRFHYIKNLTMTEQLKLNKTSLTLHGGESEQLIATVTPADASSVLMWETSDESVATVNNNGVVTAVAAGVATIKATTTDGSNLSATCVVRVLSNGVQSNNVLAMPELLTVEKGKSFLLPIAMTNNASITAVQCDLTLPDGFSVADENGEFLIDLLEDRATASHALYTRFISPNVVRLVVSSTQSEPFTGNEGELLMLHLKPGVDVEDGNYSILLSNVILADVGAVTYYAPDVATLVTVKSYALGDANGDGLVNVGDYVTTANYILALNPNPFVFSAADVDASGTIDVGDLVGIANIVLGDFTAPANAPHHDNDVTLTGESVTTADGRVIVTLNMANEVPLAAWQMDINLPEGLTLASANLSSRASHHSLSLNELNNGKLRLLGSSSMNDVVSGTEGALLEIVLEGVASDNAALRVSDALLAEADMTTHGVSPFTVALGNSAVKEVRSDVRIYAQGTDVIVETPIATTVELIASNGMTQVVNAQAGVNTYHVGRGICIVRVLGQVAKFRF